MTGAALNVKGKSLRLSNFWDLSPRKKIEKDLVESQERFKRFAEVTKEGIFIHDDGVIIDANQALADMLGVSVAEMIGRKTSDFSENNSDKLSQKFRKEGYPSTPYEVTLQRKDGTLIPAEILAATFMLNGKPLRVARLWDISNRKKMEEALTQSEQKFPATSLKKVARRHVDSHPGKNGLCQ